MLTSSGELLFSMDLKVNFHLNNTNSNSTVNFTRVKKRKKQVNGAFGEVGDWNATLASGELDQEAREQVLADFDFGENCDIGHFLTSNI